MVRAAVAAGVDWVQLRDRSLGGAALLEIARELQAAIAEGAAEAPGPSAMRTLIVNRRLDVAAALAGAAAPGVAIGVHLGFDAPPLPEARSWLSALGSVAGPVGVAAHAPEEVAGVARAGAGYAHLAPIFDPLSKPRERPALGTAALARASEERGACRLIAQGGIEASNAGQALEAGADGVAVTGAILAATHPGDAAARLRATLDAAARPA